MIGSIAVMQSNDMGFDWLGCQSPLLHRSDQMLRCLLCAASTNLRVFSRREKSTNAFVLFCVLFSKCFSDAKVMIICKTIKGNMATHKK
jgi:hypothetical protein